MLWVQAAPSHASNFATPNCKRNQQGTLSQGCSNLQFPWTCLWQDSDKSVDLALTSPESRLQQIIIIDVLQWRARMVMFWMIFSNFGWDDKQGFSNLNLVNPHLKYKYPYSSLIFIISQAFSMGYYGLMVKMPQAENWETWVWFCILA